MDGKKTVCLIPIVCVSLIPAAAPGQTSKDFVPLLVELSRWEYETPEALYMAMSDMKGFTHRKPHLKQSETTDMERRH
jgi:hypothetical protein